MPQSSARDGVVRSNGKHPTMKVLRSVGQPAPLRPFGERLQRRDVVGRGDRQPLFQLMDVGRGPLDGRDLTTIEGDDPDIHRDRDELAVDLDRALEALAIVKNDGVGGGGRGRGP